MQTFQIMVLETQIQSHLQSFRKFELKHFDEPGSSMNLHGRHFGGGDVG